MCTPVMKFGRNFSVEHLFVTFRYYMKLGLHYITEPYVQYAVYDDMIMV